MLSAWEDTTFKFTDPEGYEIFVYRWTPPAGVNAKAVVQIEHGAAEHALRYERVARFLPVGDAAFVALRARRNSSLALRITRVCVFHAHVTGSAAKSPPHAKVIFHCKGFFVVSLLRMTSHKRILYLLQNLLQVDHRRFGIQIPEHLISSGIFQQPGDPTVGIHETSE